MSEERFLAIEHKLDAHTDLHADHTLKLDSLTAAVDDLKTGQEEMRLHLIRIDGRLDKAYARFDQGDARFDKIEVTLEQMRDDIKQIAEGHAATQAAIARSTQEVIAHIDKKFAPLEIAVRAYFGAG